MEEITMSRCPKNPLRPLLEEEHRHLIHLSRCQAAPASQVARAKAVLAVADGGSYMAAAQAAGRRSGDAVAALVARFNVEGLAAVIPRHGGGRRPGYTALERERILAEARRIPDRERDGTAVWSLTTLRRALRRNGLPHVSTATIWRVLVDADLSWQRHRSWCDTGTAQRRRKRAGRTVVVTVIDPDAEAKKN
jgi:transposase